MTFSSPLLPLSSIYSCDLSAFSRSISKVELGKAGDGWLAGWVEVEGVLRLERMRELFICLFESWFGLWEVEGRL